MQAAGTVAMAAAAVALVERAAMVERAALVGAVALVIWSNALAVLVVVTGLVAAPLQLVVLLDRCNHRQALGLSVGQNC